MKHIILIILLTLGVLAQEVGVPYVLPIKSSGIIIDNISFTLDGEALLFKEDTKCHTWDTHIRLWGFKNANLNRCLTQKNFTFNTNHWIDTLVVNSDSMFVSLDGRVEKWDIKTWKKINEFKTPIYDLWKVPESFKILLIDDENHKLIASSNMRNIYVYDLLSMTLMKKFQGSDAGFLEHDRAPENLKLNGHSGHISAISKIINNRYFFSSSMSDKSLRKWDINSGKEVGIIKNIEFGDELWVSHDGKYILPISQDINLTLYNTKNLLPVLSFSGNNGKISSFAIDDKKYLYTFSPKNKILTKWDMTTGNEITHIVMTDYMGKLIVTKNQKYLAGIRSNAITFWTLTNFNPIIRIYPAGECGWIAMTPEGYFNASEDVVSSIRIKDTNEQERALTPEEIKKYQQPQKIQEILNNISNNPRMEK